MANYGITILDGNFLDDIINLVETYICREMSSACNKEC